MYKNKFGILLLFSWSLIFWGTNLSETLAILTFQFISKKLQAASVSDSK